MAEIEFVIESLSTTRKNRRCAKVYKLFCSSSYVQATGLVPRAAIKAATRVSRENYEAAYGLKSRRNQCECEFQPKF